MNNSSNQWVADMAGPQQPNSSHTPPVPAQEEVPNEQVSLLKRLENIASVSQVVRTFGACAIIASMSLFMLQGWAEGNDITRYLKLLAQTGLLTGAGLVLSFLVKEFKGARVFFGLALVSVVANFTILGSLTYSLFPMDMQIVDYPASMKWVVDQSALFIPVFAGALALLSAVTYFGFSIFSRQIAKPLSLAFICLSAMLLVPVRAPLIAVGMAGIALWGAWLLIQRLRKTENLAMTKETKTSLAVLLLPGLIILARAVSFYNIDDATLLAFSGLLFVALRNAASLMTEPSWMQRISSVAQFTLGAFIAFMTTQVLPSSWNDADVLIGSLVFMGFAFDALNNSRDQWWKAFICNSTTITIVGIGTLNSAFDSSIIYSVQALLLSGMTLALTIDASKKMESLRFSRFIAILGIVIATLMVLFDLVELAQLGNWMIIGLSGAVLIIGASLYERFGLQLRSSMES